MFKNKELEYVERAFQIERDSYNRTIKYLRDKVYKLETAYSVSHISKRVKTHKARLNCTRRNG